MIDQRTVFRLQNWARWAHTPRGAKLASCYSAEGRYVPERLRGDDWLDRSEPKPEPVDVRDALVVWRAISPANGFPVRWYLALSARYIHRMRGYEFAGYLRRHKVPVGRDETEHDGLVYHALQAAGNVLRRADVRNGR